METESINILLRGYNGGDRAIVGGDTWIGS